MSDFDPNWRLRGDLNRLESWIEAADNRLRAFYLPDVNYPRDDPPLAGPPHEFLMNRGIRMIGFASTELPEEWITGISPAFDFQKLLYGVGMESLVNGIHLQEYPDDFIETLDERGDTPSFYDSIGCVADDLEGLLSDEQHVRAELILKTIRKHRNNESHFRLHSETPVYFDRLVLEITRGLYLQYGHEESEVIELIEDEIEELRVRESEIREGEIFEFDPNDELIPEGRE